MKFALNILARTISNVRTVFGSSFVHPSHSFIYLFNSQIKFEDIQITISFFHLNMSKKKIQRQIKMRQKEEKERLIAVLLSQWDIHKASKRLDKWMIRHTAAFALFLFNRNQLFSLYLECVALSHFQMITWESLSPLSFYVHTCVLKSLLTIHTKCEFIKSSSVCTHTRSHSHKAITGLMMHRLAIVIY